MSTSKRVLVTGANGFLGCNTVRTLLKKGYEVFPFVRERSDLRGLKGLPGLQFRFGDITDRTSFEKAAMDCEIIIHHAAVYAYAGKTEEEIVKPAMVGTENLFHAAAKAGIKKIIYTSSIYAIGATDSPNKILTEKDWNDNSKIIYSKAKAQSEQFAWQLSRQFNIGMVALCPGSILGPYDYHITPGNRLIVDMMKKIGLTITIGLGFVDVRDVAAMHVEAIERGVCGERYIVSAHHVPMKDIGTIYKRLTGRFIPHLVVPRFMNIISGYMLDGLGRLFGWVPPLTADMAKELSHRYCYYDHSKIKKELGFTPIPLEETVKDTIRWFLFLNIGSVKKEFRDQFLPDPSWQC